MWLNNNKETPINKSISWGKKPINADKWHLIYIIQIDYEYKLMFQRCIHRVLKMSSCGLLMRIKKKIKDDNIELWRHIFQTVKTWDASHHIPFYRYVKFSSSFTNKKQLLCTKDPTYRLFSENLVSRIHILIKQTLDSGVFASVSSQNSQLEITFHFQSNLY